MAAASSLAKIKSKRGGSAAISKAASATAARERQRYRHAWQRGNRHRRQRGGESAPGGIVASKARHRHKRHLRRYGKTRWRCMAAKASASSAERPAGANRCAAITAGAWRHACCGIACTRLPAKQTLSNLGGTLARRGGGIVRVAARKHKRSAACRHSRHRGAAVRASAASRKTARRKRKEQPAMFALVANMAACAAWRQTARRRRHERKQRGSVIESV